MSAIVKERSNVLNVEVSKKADRRNVNDRNVKGNGETLELKRGMIVFVDLGSVDEGRSSSVQKGKRPCLIVSNNANNKFSGNLSVIVLTSKMTKKPLPTHVLLTTDEVSYLKVNSICLCEQILTISKSDIERVIGTVSDKVMQEVNKAMMIQLGLM